MASFITLIDVLILNDIAVTVSEKRAVGSTRADKDSLLDLTSGDDSLTSPAVTRGGRGQQQQTTTDLLADIFGTSSLGGSGGGQGAAQRSGVDDIMSLFGAPSAPAPAPAARQAAPLQSAGGMGDLFSSSAPGAPSEIPAYTSPTSGLSISFTATRDASKPQIINITTHFRCPSSSVANINFQAAVPKSMKLQMNAISQSGIGAGEEAKQAMRVMLPQGGSAIKLRLRIAYEWNGQTMQEQTDFAFPQGSY